MLGFYLSIIGIFTLAPNVVLHFVVRKDGYPGGGGGGTP